MNKRNYRILKDNEIGFVNKIRILNGANLKCIAMIFMFIDHFNKSIFSTYLMLHDVENGGLYILSKIFAILGRIAFPIFLFLLVEGLKHTHSKRKYLIQLLIFAAISEVPYDLCIYESVFEPEFQNIFFTIAIAIAVLWIIDELRKNVKDLYRLLFGIIVCIAAALFSEVMHFDYGFLGIVIPVILYILYDYRIMGTGLGYATVAAYEPWSFMGFFLVNMYNGKRGHIKKWIGYVFYPAHLIVLGLIRVVLFK